MDEIDTIHDLVWAVSQVKTMGYEIDFDILPNTEQARTDGGFFLLVEVRMLSWVEGISNLVNGQWWFDDDGEVIQVL